jgi:hypothetical protein
MSVWRERQQRDRQTREIAEYLEKQVLPTDVSTARALGIAAQAQYCDLVEGALFHRAERRLGGRGKPETLLQVFVPDVDELRERLVARAHGSAPREGDDFVPEGAHEGAVKMYERLRDDWFWPSMLADCKRSADACFVCKEHTAIRHNYGLGEMTTSAKIGPHGTLWADAAGPFPATKDGNRYFIVFVNERGQVRVAAVPDLEAPTVVAAYTRVALPTFGVSSLLVTDRAGHFNAELALKVYAALGLPKATTTSYHPQGNGKAENAVKIVKRVLAKLMSEYGGDWDTHLGQVEARLSSWVSEPSKMSPFQATTGRQMQLPSAFENPMHVTQSAEVEKMKEVDKVVKEARDEAAAEYKRQYDRGREDVRFAVGDKVWWREHVPGSLQPKRTGPYLVKEVMSPLNYELEDLPQGPKIGRRHRVVHVQHLDRFEVEEKRQAEEVVEEIVKHKRRGKKVTYWVKWSSGEETWEPTEHFLDKEGAQFVVTLALKDYWRKTPALKAWEPLYPG